MNLCEGAFSFSGVRLRRNREVDWEFERAVPDGFDRGFLKGVVRIRLEYELAIIRAGSVHTGVQHVDVDLEIPSRIGTQMSIPR